MKLIFSALLAIALLTMPGLAVAANERHWHRDPIPVELTVGNEQRIDLPATVRLGLPTALADSTRLRAQVLNNSVYLTALAPFDAERIYMTLESNGEIILFDLIARVASKEAATEPSEPIEVIIDEALTPAASAVEKDAAPAASLPTITPIVLARYAAQQLYAPRRLVPDIAGIERSPMHSPRVVPLYANDAVQTLPIASWNSAGLFVTAVLFANQSAATIELDPRMLRGEWLHVAFQHRSLIIGPKNSATDVTTLYFISDKPFVQALGLGEQ